MPKDRLAQLTQIVPLAALPELGAKILNGETKGRVVVDVNA
jgi:acrylyl-CoA reductase (NADPH)